MCHHGCALVSRKGKHSANNIVQGTRYAGRRPSGCRSPGDPQPSPRPKQMPAQNISKPTLLALNAGTQINHLLATCLYPFPPVRPSCQFRIILVKGQAGPIGNPEIRPSGGSIGPFAPSARPPSRRAENPESETEQMKTFANAVVNFLKNDDGPTAVEYAVMLSLILVVCISAITSLGSNANNTFSYVGTHLAKTSGS